jgi:hypothetical protein
VRSAALVVALAAAGCTETHWTALPHPIPLTLSGDGGGLLGAGTFFTDPAILPTVVDTGTVLTTYDDGSGTTQAPTGEFTIFGVSDGVDIPRMHITDVQFFESALGSLGVGDGAIKVGAIFAGDNLSRFAASFDYRGTAPTLTLMANLQPCSCEFQPQPGAAQCTTTTRFDCSSDIAFSLAGGQNSALQSQTRVIVGNNQYTYPPTRVLIDACVEPFPDPLTTVVPGNTDYAICSTVSSVCPSAQYLPSGVDTRMLVASGFPGLALSAGAYDRLRGAGAADALMAAGPTVMLHLPDAADGAGVAAAQTTLGRLPSEEDAGAAALALVSHEYYFGPCALVARSRRVRRANSVAAERTPCLLGPGHKCEQGGQMAVDPYSAACQNATGNPTCGDDNPNTPTPAVIELAATIPVYVLPDVSPLFLGINADVRPSETTIEGVIGTEVLRRLVTTLDYPGGRLIARCASDDNCKAYPRLSLPDLVRSSCDDFCHGAHSMRSCPAGLTACAVAP